MDKWKKLDRPLNAGDVGSYVKEQMNSGGVVVVGRITAFEHVGISSFLNYGVVIDNRGFYYADPSAFFGAGEAAWYARIPSGLSLLATKEKELMG